MKKRKFSSVGDVLPTLLKQLGLEQRFKEHQILARWSDVVGDDIAARSEALRIDRGVLYVRVDHGAWMQELHFIEKDLLAKIRAIEPGVALNRIRFSTRENS